MLNVLKRTLANETGVVRLLVLSIHFRHCQGGPSPSNLSSRPERSEGTCSSTFGHSECAVGESTPGSVSPSTQTADPSATLPRISCRTYWHWRTSCGFPY